MTITRRRSTSTTCMRCAALRLAAALVAQQNLTRTRRHQFPGSASAIANLPANSTRTVENERASHPSGVALHLHLYVFDYELLILGSRL